MLITREALALRRMALDVTFPPGTFDNSGAVSVAVDAVKVLGAAELVGADIRVHGRIESTVHAECDRCTGDVTVPVAQEFDVLYRPLASIAREEEIEISADEMEVGFYPGEGIELADVVKEQIILALPMKVVCNAECRGLCPVCGVNLNQGACHCAAPAVVESPFASLRHH